MIDRTHALTLTRQAAVLGISRGAVYYVPRAPTAWGLALMRRIDALHGIAINMDGMGCWRDNIFVERLWRTLKSEEVCHPAYDTVSAAAARIDRYLTLYNTRRPHSSLQDRTPAEAYFHPQSLAAAA